MLIDKIIAKSNVFNKKFHLVTIIDLLYERNNLNAYLNHLNNAYYYIFIFIIILLLK